MAIEITFFLAPDDDTAAATRRTGPGRAFTSLDCRDFCPDDAVVEWEACFDAPSEDLPALDRLHAREWPRYVAPIVNDGTGVFAVPEKLTRTLAAAGPDELRACAARWAERLRITDGDDMTDDDPPTVLEGVARLARTASDSGGALRLYCWHY
ncbi:MULTISPECIES: hypothetical protein [unclassified Streptomyces]|uniref:hypothetical protein n=1 Tax=unclassified Streptomyces TaxID=2593676 RepID=UPI000938B666|nr:hypothetical protein [Streptomyces sp. TSRI0107]